MGFLEAYKQVRTPDEQNALLLQWINQRRNDLFRELRAEAPIFAAPTCEIVSRYADVVEVLTDKDFTVEPYRQAGSTNFLLGMDDGPERDRALAILKLVVKRTDLERIRSLVTETTKALIGDALPHGTLDLVGQFARLVPLRVADRYFGVPGPDAQSLGNWISALSRAFIYGYSTRHFLRDPQVEREAEQARKDYADYVGSLVVKTLSERQAGAPDQDNVLGRLITMQRAPATAFTTQEIIRNLMGLINGMIENITAAVTNVLYVLLSLPVEEYKKAVAVARFDNTELLLHYTSEALRLEAPVPFLARECLRDHILAKGTRDETVIAKGRRVLAAICAAGRDERVVRDPETFRPERTDYQPIHFGVGQHECVGKYISQVQIVEMVKSLLVLEGIRCTDGAAGTPTYDNRSFFPKSFTVAFAQKRAPALHAPQAVQTPLTAIMTIKPPYDVHYRALQMLLAQVSPQVQAILNQAGTVHFARFVFLEHNTKLALITTYDGSFENYIKNYIELAGPLFDKMLEHMKDAPPLPVQKYRDEFVEYVRRVDVASAVFYSAYPTSTVQDVRTHEDGASARHLRAPDHDTPARDIEAQQVTPLAREEWADIQGFILRNYHMPLVRHFILRIDGAREARRFIAAVVNSADGYPQITTAAAEWKKGNAPEYCLNIGFTYAGLKALKLPASSLESFVHSPAFVEGAFARAPRVGDVEESARDRWDDALRKPDDAHILLSLYAGEDKEWRSRTDALEALFQRHAIKSWQPAYEGKALSGGRIHFGYRDGISQPTIAGAPAPEFPDSQPPVSPGAFLLGYPSQWKDFRYPVPHPPELGRNGSFVAFRILEQDVAAFEQYLKETAAELKERYPEIDMNEEMLAAKICGRWRNGVPLVLSPDSPDTKIPREQWNNFTYAKDIEGYGCPFGSHMRRTHPRGDMVAGADGHQHRIIRRGMPYGPPYEEAPNEKRGLFGLFICVSLEDQFEFLMADWINQGGFRPGVPTGAKDPLFGSKREEKSQFIIPTEKWPLPLPGLHRFVTTRGGAYCFLPSITALKYIAAL